MNLISIELIDKAPTLLTISIELKKFIVIF